VRIRMTWDGWCGGEAFFALEGSCWATYVVSTLPPLPVGTRASTNDPVAAGCVPRGSVELSAPRPAVVTIVTSSIATGRRQSRVRDYFRASPGILRDNFTRKSAPPFVSRIKFALLFFPVFGDVVRSASLVSSPSALRLPPSLSSSPSFSFLFRLLFRNRHQREGERERERGRKKSGEEGVRAN